MPKWLDNLLFFTVILGSVLGFILIGMNIERYSKPEPCTYEESK